jgi:hypothetical protein
MIISPTEVAIPNAQNVQISNDALTVELEDGRSLSAPLAWYPRLAHASPEERQHWRLIGAGQGIHWEDLDEDISIEGLILGMPSSESQTSLRRWLEKRTA